MKTLVKNNWLASKCVSYFLWLCFQLTSVTPVHVWTQCEQTCSFPLVQLRSLPGDLFRLRWGAVASSISGGAGCPVARITAPFHGTDEELWHPPHLSSSTHHYDPSKRQGKIYGISRILRKKTWFFFSLFICFNWRIITLRQCDGFCHTSVWISLRYTCVPSILNPPPTSFPTLRLNVNLFIRQLWFQSISEKQNCP